MTTKPPDVDALARAALTSFARDSSKDAAAAAQALLDAEPEHPLALLILGVLAERAEDLPKALDLLQRAVRVAPDYADAQNSLGIVLYRLGRPEDAASHFSRAMKLAPRDPLSRNNLGNVRRAEGRLREARTLYEKAASLDPRFVEALTNLAMVASEEGRHADSARHATAAVAVSRTAATVFGLAKVRARSGELAGARALYAEALALDPSDRYGASLRLAALGETPAPDRAPAPYVRQVFDDMAAGYDRTLTLGLGYVGPALIADTLRRIRPEGGLAVLDLGCGTGLCGAVLRPLAQRLDGVDLAPAMVRLAENRAIYDALAVSDVVDYLGGVSTPYDVVVAGDVFCYLGDLRPVLERSRSVLAVDGLLIFTVEASPEDGDSAHFRVSLTGRYAHRRGYVEAELDQAGFTGITVAEQSVRREAGEPVPGYLVTARA